MNINTDISARLLRQVVNPGQSRSCYDSKILANFGLDDFKQYVWDHTNGRDRILPCDYGLLERVFPTGTTIWDLAGGSGCNGDKHFKKYETWRAALYDVWEEIQTKQAGQ